MSHYTEGRNKHQSSKHRHFESDKEYLSRTKPVEKSHRKSVPESGTGSKKLRCHKCPFVTDSRTELRKHDERHEEGSYSCDHCNMPFRNKGHLTGHKRQVHGVGRVDKEVMKRCTMCPYTTIHSGDFARHKRKHRLTDFPCRFCNYPFTNEKIMEAHVRKTHKAESGFQDKIKMHKREYTDNPKYTRRDEHLDSEGLTSRCKRREEVEEELTIRVYQDMSNSHHFDRRNSSISNEREVHRKRDFEKSGNSKYVVSSYDRKKERQNRKVRNEGNKEVTITQSDKSELEKKKTRAHSSGKHRTGKSDRVLEEGGNAIYEVMSDVSDTSLASIDEVSVSASAEDMPQDDSSSPLEYEVVTVFLQNDTQTKAYKCLKCSYITVDAESLPNHSSQHNGAYYCSGCKISFVREDELEKHIEMVHESHSDDCKSAESKESLNESSDSSDSSQEDAVAETKEQNCAFCDFKTKSYIELKNHIDGHISGDTDTAGGEDDYNENGDDEVVIIDDNDKITAADEKTKQINRILVDNQDKTNKKLEENETLFTAVRVGSVLYSEAGERSEDTPETHDNEGKHNGKISTFSQKDSNKKEHTEEVTDEEVTLITGNDEHDKSSLETGRLDKDLFRKTKQLYAEVFDKPGFKYECLVCESDNLFKTLRGLWYHFRKHHKKLRHRICKSCPYCSKPFPQLN